MWLLPFSVSLTLKKTRTSWLFTIRLSLIMQGNVRRVKTRLTLQLYSQFV